MTSTIMPYYTPTPYFLIHMYMAFPQIGHNNKTSPFLIQMYIHNFHTILSTKFSTLKISEITMSPKFPGTHTRSLAIHKHASRKLTL
jgi:hypothetical protein